MAFHQPTRQAVQRNIRVDTTNYDAEAEPIHRPQPIEESQTWVLFSPETDAGTTTSYLSSVQESSQKTPGRSRLSDLGSLNTLARSEADSQPILGASPHGDLSDIVTESILEDDAELDSLDSHLPDFRSIPNQQLHASNTVLPTHDGLGSFRLDTTALTTEMQEQLYAFERYNPRRIKRRRESFDLVPFELESERAQEIERNRRVEAWRQDQSRTLLEEIQKETRRRRISGGSMHRPRISRTASQEAATTGTTSAVEMTPDSTVAGSEWHEQDDGSIRETQDGMWSRLTRRFMKDYMGIDDHMLSVLFGEALPEVVEEDLSSTPKASAAFGIAAAQPSETAVQDVSSWQMRLLERVARELGIFVHHMSNPHPGAFSTYARVHQMAIPYAGLPAIPETIADAAEAKDEIGQSGSSPAMPQFRPTVAAIDIPGRASPSEVLPDDTPKDTTNHARDSTFTQQEWEQDLDIRLVFRYLRSRFISSRPSTSSNTHHHNAQPSRPLTPSESAARAARVRAHHPLVGRSGVRPAAATALTVGLGVGNFVVRHASSCASQSTKRRSSVSSRASERYGWMGSMGSAGWGEV